MEFEEALEADRDDLVMMCVFVWSVCVYVNDGISAADHVYIYIYIYIYILAADQAREFVLACVSFLVRCISCSTFHLMLCISFLYNFLFQPPSLLHSTWILMHFAECLRRRKLPWRRPSRRQSKCFVSEQKVALQREPAGSCVSQQREAAAWSSNRQSLVAQIVLFQSVLQLLFFRSRI